MRTPTNANGTMTREENAKVAQSLLKHSREVYRYAVNYCVPTEANEYLEGRARETFVRHLDRMINDLNNLMKLARDKGISHHCNIEQIEAYIQAARDAVKLPENKVQLPTFLN